MRFGVHSFSASPNLFSFRKRGFLKRSRPSFSPSERFPMKSRFELRCRDCGKDWGNQPRSACEDCFAPLEVVYDFETIRGLTRQAIEQRPQNMWRYAELLPLPESFKSDLPIGFTPLIPAPRLASQLGAGQVFLKNDAVCLPTLSFKDRVVAVALAQA